MKGKGTEATARIYVACLAAYNSGHLHGRWINAAQDAEAIRNEVSQMLKDSPCSDAEEWAIHDYEGFGPVKLSESESFGTVAALAKAVEEHGELFAHFYAHESTDDVEQAVSDFGEKHRGAFDSLADYVEHFWNETGEYRRDEKNWWSPINYVDWERMAHDLELSGDIFTIENEGKVHVFST